MFNQHYKTFNLIMEEYEVRYKYYCIYNKLINKSLSRGLDKSKIKEIMEKHHILPRCMGGKDEESNYVLLTPKEHYIAHLLLHRIYPEHKGLLYAVFKMASIKSKRSFISSRMYEQLRLEYIESQKGHLISEETRRKISESQKGKKISNDTKNKISQANKNPSDETRRKMSNSQKSRKDLKEIGRKNLSQYWKGKTRSEETKKKMSVAQSNKIISKEQKEKISNSNKGKILGPPSEDHKNKISLAKKGKPVKTKVIDSKGRVFDSMKECAEVYNTLPGMIRYWIKNHPEKGFKYFNN